MIDLCVACVLIAQSVSIVQRLDVNNEASLTVQCNESNKTDPWSYIKGMDLSADQVYAKIVRLEIKYCPIVQDVIT